MSQSSFLEAVVSWDETQCRQNVDEALPKLLSQLQQTEVLQEEIGILKIICQSFLPCLEVQDAEERLFSQITNKSCETWDKILMNLKELPKQLQIQQEIIVLLELLAELLDCFLLCVKFIQSSSASLDIATVHSLPYGTIHLLKGTYSHCKDSSEIYGDVLAGVTGPLSLLFKKAHALQVAFISILEKIEPTSAIEQDAQDLCYICQGLFEVCQIVTSLDLKLMCSIWKAISRFSTKHKENVKDGLDIDTMVIYLCNEITSGYLYLFQLATPQLESQDMSLSQGDTAAFQKSVKVLGYQMRIMTSLVDAFVDYISECETHIIRLLLVLQRNLPPSLKAPEIASHRSDEIKRQLLNGTEPLVSTLVGNRRFLEYLTSAAVDLEDDMWLPYLLLLIKVMDCLPKQQDDVVDKWISPKIYEGDTPRNGILTILFKAVENCYVELSLSVNLPGVICGGKPLRDVSLYEFVCTHFCAFVGSFPARHFHLLEEVLIENLLSYHIYCSMLAIDVWCFLARFGTADLCFQQTSSLIDLWLELCSPVSNSRLLTLVGRLIKFLAPEHQTHLVKKYPPCDNISLWSEIPLLVLPSQTAREVVDEIVHKSIKNIHNFIHKSDKLYKDLLELVITIRSLNSLYQSPGLTTKYMNPGSQQMLMDNIRDLWNMLDFNSSELLLDTCFGDLLELSAFVITELQNSDLLNIFQCICTKVCETGDSVKLAITRFLQNCGKRKFPPSAEQPQIFSKIPQVYDKLLCDGNALVHTKAVEAFTLFAETTPHETLVPECIGTKTFLQDIVVAYLSKIPHISEGFSEEEYLQNQKISLASVKEDPPVMDAVNPVVDSLCQPSTKRKRLQQEENGDKVDDILSVIETNLLELEQCCSNTSVTSKDRLQAIVTRILKILNENG